MFEDDVNFYIVAELMRGGDLYNYMLTHKRLSERTAASVIKQTLQALNYMHQQKILHWDMKPENILLTELEAGPELHVKLTDFGRATPFQKGAKLTEYLGSPLYMSPELVN